jgi:hypothetical protein
MPLRTVDVEGRTVMETVTLTDGNRRSWRILVRMTVRLIIVYSAGNFWTNCTSVYEDT